MKIKIREMELRYFKGIKYFKEAFKDFTNIWGDNGTGKTTVFDAFTWLLFGKNSHDEKEFNIKTLDEKNEPLHNLEHEVSATLECDGRPIALRRVYKEKWVKKKGAEKKTFDGHETLYFIDDSPLSQGEYQSKVSLILKEELAKLVTNPLYFNQMKWQDRRRILESMAGEISETKILDKIATLHNKQEIMELTNEFNNSNEPTLSKKIESIKKKISAKSTKLKDRLKEIPIRIEEIGRNKPDALDYVAIAKEIEEKQTAIVEIESTIEGSTGQHRKALEEIRNKETELSNLKSKLQQLDIANKSSKSARLTELTSKIGEITSTIGSIQSKSRQADSEISLNHSTIESNKQRIATLTKQNDQLRKDWHIENAKTLTIDPASLTCPSCKQALPEADIEITKADLLKNFNTAKANKLKKITEEGEQNAITIQALNTNNDQLLERLSAMKSESEARAKELDIVNGQIKEAQEEIAKLKSTDVQPTEEMNKLQEQINKFVVPAPPDINNDELKQRKAAINFEIDNLKLKATTKEQIEKIEQRIAELEAEERTVSQELANFERFEFTIEAFSKAKNELIEGSTNGMFKQVRFKMFNSLINGGEEECCECLVNGIPYPDVNQAGKVNAGIDIINALSDYYTIYAPVWVDARESIVKLLPCKSQIISLKVMAGKPLSIEQTQEEIVENAIAD